MMPVVKANSSKHVASENELIRQSAPWVMNQSMIRGTIESIRNYTS